MTNLSKQFVFTIVITLGFYLPASVAHAEILAKCGASTGYSIMLSNGLLPKLSGEKFGFSEDGFANSELMLEVEQDKESKEHRFDILFKANGKWYRDSALGQVMLLDHDREIGSFLLVSFSEGNVSCER